MFAVVTTSRLCTRVTSNFNVSNQIKLLGFRTIQYTKTQGFSSNARTAFKRANVASRRTLRERLLAPERGTAFNLGKGLLLGASAFGLGQLCYYGLGLSSEPGAIDKSLLWPQYVKDRIKATYSYFGGSIIITAGAAYSISQSRKLLSLMMTNSWLAIGATLAVTIGSCMFVLSLPYNEGLGGKQVAWAIHSGLMGAVLAPLCLVGGPLLIRAALYTAGVVGGLSTVAICAPSEKFLYMGGPLACGLGLVFVSSLGSLFLSPSTAIGASLYSISVYGGLVLFSAFLLYDTQKIIHKAELYPVYGSRPFDPINASISIYLDTLNIFIRIVSVLGGGGSKRK